MRAYLTVARNMVMSTFTYRAHILFQILGSVFSVVVLWFLWRAIFDAAGTPTIRGMTFGQTFLYVALAAALFVMMRSWVEWELHWQVRSGDIIVHFFRPYSLVGIVFANALGNVAGNLITITVPSLLAIFLLFHAPVPGWVSLALFVPAVVQAYLLSFLIDFFIGVTAFRTESIWGLSATKEVLVLFLSGGMVPLAFFPDPVRDVLTVLPFASMYNTPISLLAGGLTDPGTIAQRLGLQTLWVLVLYALVRLYYGVTVKKLTVAGG
jgi:ABC-2 type transport system permease protein